MILLSICIATRNRQRYAASCVRSILNNKNACFEIILQDNSDVRNLDAALADLADDRRLLYNYTPPPLSSIANFNRALELSRGKYVTLIGDDDFINPEIFEIMMLIDRIGVDCIVGTLGVGYRWPATGMTKTLFTNTIGGELAIQSYTGRVRRGGGRSEIERLLASGAYQYLRYRLPKFYHGVVKKDLFERIRSKTGFYIGGLSPDIYTAVSLSLHAKSVLYIDYPLTIPGVCAESSSVNEGSLKKTGNTFGAMPLLRDVKCYERNSGVPDVYCLETVWADSCLAALKDLRRYDLLGYFNVHALVGAVLVEHPELTKKAMQHLACKGQIRPTYLDRALVCWHMLRARFFLVAPRIVRRLMIIFRLSGMVKLRGVDNVEDAERHLKAYLDLHRGSYQRLQRELLDLECNYSEGGNPS